MRRGNPPKRDELPDLVADVEYELEMLDHAVARWADVKERGVYTRDDERDEYSWMELSMLHARNLCAFFAGNDASAAELTCPACNAAMTCPACSNRIANNDDVYAVDWLDDWGTGEEKVMVRKLRGEMAKLNKWLMHVTASRARDRAEQPAWSPVDTQRDVHQLWTRFQSQLSPLTTWRAPQATRGSRIGTSTTSSSTTTSSVILFSEGIDPRRR